MKKKGKKRRKEKKKGITLQYKSGELKKKKIKGSMRGIEEDGVRVKGTKEGPQKRLRRWRLAICRGGL